MKIVRDSGFGYQLAYPTSGIIKLMFTIQKEDDRVILLEYPPGPLRRVYRSQLHTLEPRTRNFVDSLISVIDSGVCDTTGAMAVELYKDMKHERQKEI